MTNPSVFVPGRMPQQFIEYWVHGKGAAKIRWGQHGDFKRCVRNLRRYFPKNPEGLCNRLHTRALGVPPGQEGKHTMGVIEFVDGFADIGTDERKQLAEKGHALPDGSYPIRNVSDLKNAIQAYGRSNPGDRAKVRAHIMKRARALGHEELIPEQWTKKTAALAKKTCPPGQELLDGKCVDMSDDDDEYALTAEEQAEADALVPMIRKWRSVLAPIDKPTGDKRRFAVGSISHRDLPLPIMFQKETGEGHKQSVIVGRMLEVDIDDEYVRAAGDWLTGDDAERAYELVDAGVLKPSVDLDDLEFEIQDRESGDKFDPNQHCSEDSCRPSEMVVLKGRISGATLVSIPAFAEVTFENYAEPDEAAVMAALDEDDCEICSGEQNLAGSAALAGPTTDWFIAELDGPTPITVTAEGQIYGHLARWDTCHLGFAHCVNPPRSRSNYAYFHTGEVLTAEGERVAVGKIVMGGPHADLRKNYMEAIAHYDDSTTAAAVVRAGEDEWGIWVAGAVLAHLSDEQRAELRRSPLSGDWRRIGGGLELIGALVVNVPAFPVPRGYSADSEPFALVAAGCLPLAAEAPAEDALAVSGEQMADVVEEVLARRRRRRTAYGEIEADFRQMDRADRNRQRAELLVSIGES